MRRYTDRLPLVAGRMTGPCPVTAGRRERRHPAEAAPRGPTARLDNAFWPHSPSGPGSARPRLGGCPSGCTPPAGRGGPGPFTPLRCPGCWRGVASRDQPPENPPVHSGSRRWTLLSPGVGHGSLPCAATAQPTHPEGIAGAWPPVASAWGQRRGSSGRPSPRLGTRVSGSFTSA